MFLHKTVISLLYFEHSDFNTFCTVMESSITYAGNNIISSFFVIFQNIKEFETIPQINIFLNTGNVEIFFPN